MKKLLLLIAMYIVSIQYSYAEELTSTLTVSGYGSQSVVPNAFQITVTLEEKGPVVTQLNEKMQARLSDIIRFLLAANVAERDIQSININLYPNYESTPQGRREAGVVLTRQIRIQSQDLQKYDSLLDGLLSRGINRIDQFAFINTEQRQADKRALEAAVTDAQEKAQTIAQQLGNEIIGVQSVSQHGASSPKRLQATRMMAEDFSPSMPGTMDVNANVQVTFLISPVK